MDKDTIFADDFFIALNGLIEVKQEDETGQTEKTTREGTPWNADTRS